MKSVEKIAKNPKKQWYYNITEAAEILGCTRQKAAVFLNEHCVPPHRIIGKSKSYFLDDIIKAVESTKWKA